MSKTGKEKQRNKKEIKQTEKLIKHYTKRLKMPEGSLKSWEPKKGTKRPALCGAVLDREELLRERAALMKCKDALK